MTKNLCQDFDNESKDISNDIKDQTEHFSNFDDQRAKIGDLEQRIASGQERAVKLGERLAKCKERVGQVEKRDAEEVKRMARVYRGVWSTVCIIAGILLLLFVIHHLRMPHTSFQRGDSVLGKLPHELNKSMGHLPPAVEKMLAEIRRDKEKPSKNEIELDRRKEDEKGARRLKVFDEL